MRNVARHQLRWKEKDTQMNIDLEQALIELAKQITANQIPVQDRLWTSKEIAYTYLL